MFTQPAPVADAPAFTAPVPAAPAAPVFAQTPTAEQAAILEASRTGADLAIEAGAGTGKTSTLKMAAQILPGRSLYVAYNRAIADDARATFPAGTHCSTAHGLAFQAVGRKFEHRLRAPRVPAREVARILGIPAVMDLGKQALTSVKVARLVMDTVARFCHSADTALSMSHVPPVPGIEGDAWLELRMQTATLAARAWADLARPDGGLRFTHDHYLKMWALAEPSLPYSTIFLDEAQDANPVIAQVVMAQQAQKILVGDRSQAIYGWRGAVDAMDGFMTAGADRYALTQSWRFGQAIAAEANEWLDLLDAPLRLTGNPSRESRLGRLEAADAVLCRSNAGAVAEILQALEAGHPTALVGGGDDIRRLAEACRDLRNGRGTSHPELMAFKSWAEVQDYAERDADGGDLKVFVKLVDSYGAQAIIDLVNKLVPEDSARVIVSTAHKAKGREWPTVRLAVDFHERPVHDIQTGEILPAEVMLRYVACTRAKDVLDKGAPGVPVTQEPVVDLATALFGPQPPNPFGDLFRNDVRPAVHRTTFGPSDAPAPAADSTPMDTEQKALAGPVELPQDTANWLKLYKDAKANKEQWAAVEAKAEEKIKEFLGDAEEATVGGLPAVSWKTSKPGTQLDGTALKRDYPDLYEQYSKPKKAARPFKLTGPWAQ